MGNNLEGIEDVLGSKKENLRPNERPIEKLDPLPGKEAEDEQAAALELQNQTLVNPGEENNHLIDEDPDLIKPTAETLARMKKDGIDIDPGAEKAITDPVEDEEGAVPAELLDGNAKPEDKPAEKPAEEVELLSDEEVGKLSDKSQKAFKAMRIEIAELKKAKPASGSPEADERLVEANKALEEAHNTIARLNLAEDPRFKAKYQGQKDIILSQLKEQAKALEYDEGIVDILANLGLRDRLNYISEKAPLMKDVSMPLLTSLDTIQATMTSELQSATANLAEMQSLQQTQIAELQGKTVSASIANAAKGGIFMFTKVEGNKEWNDTVDALTTKASDIVTSNNAQLQTDAIVAGAAAPMLLDLYKRERATSKALRAQLGNVTKASPKITETSEKAPTRKKTPSTMTLDDLGPAMDAKRRERQGATA